MNAAAEHAVHEEDLPMEEGQEQLSDEDVFEQAFNERFGEEQEEPDEVDQLLPEGDQDDAGQQVASDEAPAQQKGEEAEQKQVDIPEWYDALPDEAKELFDKNASDLAALQDQYTALHGRVAPVQQENARLRRQLEEQSQPAPTGGQGNTPSQSPTAQPVPTSTANLDDVEEFQEFKEAFPEEARAIEAIFGRQAQHITHLASQLGEVTQGLQQIQSVSTKSEREAALKQLSEAHPDWMQVRHSDDFEQWRATQPPSVAMMADSPNVNECIYILDRYKQDVWTQRQLDKRNQPAPQTSHESSAARAVRERRQQLRTVPSLDPQGGDVGLPAGNPEQFLSEEDIWEREVERRLRAQRDSRR